MVKRYQVFVSSTYADLKDERRAVIETLMKVDCIPAGMELFSASDEEQFNFIKRVIDDCDYYLLIIGGRYGSVTPGGVSYTEKECDYALERGLKVIALLHGAPGDIPVKLTERTEEGQRRLEAFREKVKKGRLVDFWTSPEQLQAKVALAMLNAIRTFPAVGWVRADRAANEKVLADIAELREENQNLRTELLKQEVPFDQVYDLSKAQEFYERVAYQYDQRNTELRYKAHQKTVGAIREKIEGRDKEFRVVDLGCGTGKIIASSFVHSRNLLWIGVDYSAGMLAQFCQNMDESAIRFATVEADIQDTMPKEEISSADVVLLCFVLTTVQRKNLITDVMGAITAGSSLIISDIHPSYTTTRPYYDFDIPNDGSISLKPQPIYPDIIAKLAAENNLVQKSYEIIYNRDGVPYSFLLEFTKS